MKKTSRLTVSSNAYLLNCLLTGAFRSFADIFIYVTNNKFLCIIHIITFINFFIFLHSTVSKITALTLCKILARLHFLLQFLLQLPGVPPLHFLELHHCIPQNDYK